MAIYNSDYTLVFEDVGDMVWQSNYDRIAKRRVIRISNGNRFFIYLLNQSAG